MALESIKMLVPGHELLYSASVGVLPLFPVQRELHKTTVDGEGMDDLYYVPRLSCTRWIMFYLKNQHLDPIIGLAVSAAGSSYCGTELSSPPWEWLKERSMDME